MYNIVRIIIIKLSWNLGACVATSYYYRDTSNILILNLIKIIDTYNPS